MGSAKTFLTVTIIMTIKNRAVLVFVNNGKILLLYRFKNGEEYYVFPGGGVDDGESIEEAAVREAKEETGLDIILGKKLWEYENKGRWGYYYLVDRFNGELRLKIGGPEQDSQSSSNVYRLEWIPLAKLKNIKLLPEIMRDRVLNEFLNRS